MARITRMTKRRLGELLQAEGLLSEEQLRAALDEQRKSNLFLGEALVKLGFVSEEAIAQTIVQQFSLPFVASQSCTITPEVLSTFPERMYYEYQFITVDKIGKTLVIVGAGLMNHDVLDELERLSGCKVCQFVSTWKDIRATLERHAKDLRRDKDQYSLSPLGTMLLDATPAPQPIPKLPTPATGVAPAAPAPPFVPAPAPGVIAAAASTTRAPAAVVAAPPPAAPAAPGVRTAPAGGSSQAMKAISATALPRLSAFSGGRPPGKTSTPGVAAVAPKTSTPGVAAAAPKTSTAGVSALAPKTSTPSATAVAPKTSTPAAAAPPAQQPMANSQQPQAAAAAPPLPAAPPPPAAPPTATPPEGTRPNPPQPQAKTGLLGLFKKA